MLGKQKDAELNLVNVKGPRGDLIVVFLESSDEMMVSATHLVDPLKGTLSPSSLSLLSLSLSLSLSPLSLFFLSKTTIHHMK